jgi:hypothetical protein
MIMLKEQHEENCPWYDFYFDVEHNGVHSDVSITVTPEKLNYYYSGDGVETQEYNWKFKFCPICGKELAKCV